jgi:hypothetical protein
MKFSTWLDTFLEEKGVNLDQILEVEGSFGTNYIPVECLVDLMKQAPKVEQEGIKKMLVKIDFVAPGVKPVLDYFTHLAKAVAM